jgi:hypothetical protein
LVVGLAESTHESAVETSVIEPETDVAVGVGVEVRVGVDVGNGVEVGGGVEVRVEVGVEVRVGVAVGGGVGVLVAVGDGVRVFLAGRAPGAAAPALSADPGSTAEESCSTLPSLWPSAGWLLDRKPPSTSSNASSTAPMALGPSL